MDVTFAFGRLVYRTEGIASVPPLLLPFVCENERPAVAVRVVSSRVISSLHGELRLAYDMHGRELLSGPGFGALMVPARSSAGTTAQPQQGRSNRAGKIESWVDPSSGSAGFGLISLLNGLVIRDASRLGQLVVHAAGIRTSSGLCIVAGASGTGKSSLAKKSGDKAFSYNALLIDPKEGVATPLPFAGTCDDPAIASTASEPISSAVVLRRSTGALRFSHGHAAALLAHAQFAEEDMNRTDALLSAFAWAVRQPICIAEVPHVLAVDNMLECLLQFIETGSASLANAKMELEDTLPLEPMG